jgi:hypothetical protein
MNTRLIAKFPVTPFAWANLLNYFLARFPGNATWSTFRTYILNNAGTLHQGLLADLLEVG